MNRLICVLAMTVALSNDSVLAIANSNNLLQVDCPNRQESGNVDLKMSTDFYIKVAETILVEVYGERVMKQRPWKISDSKEYIAIEGSLPIPKIKGAIVKGGTVRIILSKRDCRIIELTHGK